MTVRSIHADPPPLFKDGDRVAYNELVERGPGHGFPSPILPSPSAGSQILHLGFRSPRSLPCPHVAAALAWRLLSRPIPQCSDHVNTPCATHYAIRPSSGNIYTDIALGKRSCNTYTAKPRRKAEVRRCRKDTSQQPLESP